MYNNKRRVAKKKQKYPIDKKKLTAFSDLLHPSERFGAKIDKLNEERVIKIFLKTAGIGLSQRGYHQREAYCWSRGVWG